MGESEINRDSDLGNKQVLAHSHFSSVVYTCNRATSVSQSSILVRTFRC